MKKIIAGLLLLFSTHSFAAYTSDTRCIGNNCLQNGWVTTSSGFRQVVTCKNSDCNKAGWEGMSTMYSTPFNTKCLTGGCFVEGWTTSQFFNGYYYNNIVKCTDGDCLVNGWTITSNYATLGHVKCLNNDCRHVGLVSFWQGQYSEAKCYDGDCYKNGWSQTYD